VVTCLRPSDSISECNFLRIYKFKMVANFHLKNWNIMITQNIWTNFSRISVCWLIMALPKEQLNITIVIFNCSLCVLIDFVYVLCLNLGLCLWNIAFLCYNINKLTYVVSAIKRTKIGNKTENLQIRIVILGLLSITSCLYGSRGLYKPMVKVMQWVRLWPLTSQ